MKRELDKKENIDYVRIGNYIDFIKNYPVIIKTKIAGY